MEYGNKSLQHLGETVTFSIWDTLQFEKKLICTNLKGHHLPLIISDDPKNVFSSLSIFDCEFPFSESGITWKSIYHWYQVFSVYFTSSYIPRHINIPTWKKR